MLFQLRDDWYCMEDGKDNDGENFCCCCCCLGLTIYCIILHFPVGEKNSNSIVDDENGENDRVVVQKVQISVTNYVTTYGTYNESVSSTPSLHLP